MLSTKISLSNIIDCTHHWLSHSEGCKVFVLLFFCSCWPVIHWGRNAPEWSNPQFHTWIRSVKQGGSGYHSYIRWWDPAEIKITAYQSQGGLSTERSPFRQSLHKTFSVLFLLLWSLSAIWKSSSFYKPTWYWLLLLLVLPFINNKIWMIIIPSPVQYSSQLLPRLPLHL